MGKILQISIYSVLLILVFLFFGSMLKSCGNSAADTISDTTKKVADNIENAGGEIIAKAESTLEDVGEEFEGGDINFADTDSKTTSYTADSKKPEPTKAATSTTKVTAETETTKSNDNSNSDDYEPSYVVEDTEPTPAAPAPEKKAPVTKSTTSSSASSNGASGRYLLITGNYSQEGNAKAMVKKLKNKGFSNAEHVIFEGSRYYTVLAGKYSSMSSANNAKADLGGIDAYVQKRRD